MQRREHARRQQTEVRSEMSQGKVPADLKYTATHEWVRVDGDQARIGITDFAQHELGDVVFLELPGAGTAIRSKDRFGTIESVKAASDLYAPVSGEVIEANAAAQDKPELVNDDPYGTGWMLLVRLTQRSELAGLLDAEAYRKSLEQG
jgi:glycine cleavage system H protein